MKVYNVGFIPQITHTHNPRRALGVVCQQVNLPELHTKGIQDIMDEFVSAILHPVRDIEDSTLNRMYKSLRVGEERKLENFDGLRKISAYKGDDYMNKIVQELSDPPVTFIRSMKNIGTCTRKMEDWNSWTILLQMAKSNIWDSLQIQKWI